MKSGARRLGRGSGAPDTGAAAGCVRVHRVVALSRRAARRSDTTTTPLHTIQRRSPLMCEFTISHRARPGNKARTLPRWNNKAAALWREPCRHSTLEGTAWGDRGFRQ